MKETLLNSLINSLQCKPCNVYQLESNLNAIQQTIIIINYHLILISYPLCKYIPVSRIYVCWVFFFFLFAGLTQILRCESLVLVDPDFYRTPSSHWVNRDYSNSQYLKNSKKNIYMKTCTYDFLVCGIILHFLIDDY